MKNSLFNAFKALCWMVMASALVFNFTACEGDNSLFGEYNPQPGGNDTINTSDTTRLKVIDGMLIDGSCRFKSWSAQKDSITPEGELILKKTANWEADFERTFEDASFDTVAIKYTVDHIYRVNNYAVCGAGKVSELDSLKTVNLAAGAFTNENWVTPVAIEVKVPTLTFGDSKVTPCFEENNEGTRSFGAAEEIGERTYKVPTTMEFPLHHEGKIVYKYDLTVSFSEKNVKVISIENIHARPNCDVLLYDQRETNTVDTDKDRLLRDLALDLGIKIEILPDTTVIRQNDKPGYQLNSNKADSTRWALEAPGSDGSDLSWERMSKQNRFYILDKTVNIKLTMNRNFVKTVDGQEYAIDVPVDEVAFKMLNYVKQYVTANDEVYISELSFDLMIGDVISRAGITHPVKELIERKDEITRWELLRETLEGDYPSLRREISFKEHHSVIGEVNKMFSLDLNLAIADNGLIKTYVEGTNSISPVSNTKQLVETKNYGDTLEVKTHKTDFAVKFGDQTAHLYVTLDDEANWRSNELKRITPQISAETSFVKDSVSGIYDIKVYQIVYTINIDGKVGTHKQKALVYELNLQPTFPGYRFVRADKTLAYRDGTAAGRAPSAAVEILAGYFVKLDDTTQNKYFIIETAMYEREFARANRDVTAALNNSMWVWDNVAVERIADKCSGIYRTTGAVTTKEGNHVCSFEPAGMQTATQNGDYSSNKWWTNDGWDYASILTGQSHGFYTVTTNVATYDNPFRGSLSPDGNGIVLDGNFAFRSDK